ncbi:alginate export family protein [Shewanella sp. 125m-1]
MRSDVLEGKLIRTICAVTLLLVGTNTAFASTNETVATEEMVKLFESGDDIQSLLPFSAQNLIYADVDRYPLLSWGGEWVTQAGSKPSGELDRDIQETHYFANEVKLGLNLDVNQYIGSYIDLVWQRTFYAEQASGVGSLAIESAYVSFSAQQQNLQLRLGRQYYEDSRGFVFHDSLDGLHGDASVSWHTWQWQLRLAVAKHQWISNNLLTKQESNGDNYQFLQASTNRRSHNGAVYLLNRYQQSSLNAEQHEQVLHTGLRGYGVFDAVTIGEQPFAYWYEWIYASGSAWQDNSSRRIKGFGFDLGLLIPVDHLLSAVDNILPTTWFTAGGDNRLITAYASGSGDKGGANTDTRFRQSGLQLNTGWLGKGGAKLKYYGEIVKPELSNINITTLGVRFRPTVQSSIELLWHDYQQDVPSASFFGYGLKALPNGIDSDLGQAWDLVLSYRHIDNLVVELDFAWFQPGNAFSADKQDIYMIYSELRYFF